MAFRNLTDVYILMRNNAISNRTVFHDNQYSDDRTALVVDLEAGNVKTTSKLPPDWIGDVDEIQYDMTKIKNKLKELSSMHDKHLNRPTLDDNIDEEKKIDFLTQEITQIMNNCQGKIRKLSIRANSFGSKSFTDQQLMRNIVKSLASQLQDITTNYRSNQNSYLKKIQARKERSNMFFDTSQYLPSSAIMTEDNIYDDEDLNFKTANQRQEQLQMNRTNERLITERETEITHIVKSISDLNELFKDLATMVADQGTVLDRIDYNIERVSHSVEGGLTQLEKAAKYQKSNRKMKLILILIIVFLILFFLLVITKF
ncbi:unnamed protein product [Brachionus calyciflorus]|uniref:t-SNARE coiled-coil homology domain-containing protein n=1 Tax=Brachionus calyciflorus TaxID=104777 RepID=A0A813S682_9BILA|nr:unnamed protein product [Brachionus calyciflorus]